MDFEHWKFKSCFLAVLFLGVLIPPEVVWAGFFEVSASGMYTKTEYTREDYTTYYSYNGGFAYRFFGSSALELGYSESHTKSIRGTDVTVNNTTIDMQEERVDTQVYSVSWKQYFFKPESWFHPYVKAGYARFKSKGRVSYVLKGGQVWYYYPDPLKKDSGLLGAGLQFKIGDALFLVLEGTSVFPDFKFKEWDKQVRYTAGLTMYF